MAQKEKVRRNFKRAKEVAGKSHLTQKTNWTMLVLLVALLYLLPQAQAVCDPQSWFGHGWTTSFSNLDGIVYQQMLLDSAKTGIWISGTIKTDTLTLGTMTSAGTTSYSDTEESAVFLARYDVRDTATTDVPTHSAIINQYSIVSSSETVKVTGIRSMESFGTG